MGIRDIKDSLGDDDAVRISDLDPDGNNEVQIAITAGRARVSITAGRGEVTVRTERLKIIDTQVDEEEFRSEVQVLSQINEA